MRPTGVGLQFYSPKGANVDENLFMERKRQIFENPSGYPTKAQNAARVKFILAETETV